MVMRLLKSLYGLRQSPTNCWGKIHEHLAENSLKSLKSNPCVYIYLEDGVIVILTLYIDDVLLLGKDVALLKWVKHKMTTVSQRRTWERCR